MKKLINKKQIKLLCLFVCITLFCLCTGLIIMNQSNESASADTASDNSVYAYTPINDSECNVRLIDKTIELAIVPKEAEIDGKKYKVTAIANNGFASATNLTKVRLPETVTTIGNTAFANCKKLTSITMKAVQSIGTNAFNLCTNLEYLIIPESVTSVGSTILRSTSTQVYVRISESETQELGWNSNWNGNNQNDSVEYSSEFTPSIEYTPITATFYDGDSTDETIVGYWVSEAQPFSEVRDKLTYVYIPATYEGKPVVGIKENAFNYNDIEILTIGYSTEPIIIKSYAFNGLNGSKVVINRDIEIYDGTDYSEYLFASSTVSEIYLPDTLSAIGPYMFSDCINLTDVHFISPDSENTDEENITEASTSIIKLPNTVVYIGEETFRDLKNISKISIPHSVETVEKNILNGWVASQIVEIDYEKESDLPSSWDSAWKSMCNGTIIYNGKFSITYELNGGTHLGNPTEYTSSDVIILNDASKVGSTFEGWYDNEDFTGSPITVIGKGSSGDLTLYAKFKSISYVVYYRENCPQNATHEVEGETVESTFVYLYGAGEYNTLRMNGYKLVGWGFVGWNTQADGSGTNYADASKVQNLTNSEPFVELYAQWQPNNYNISYEQNKPATATGLLSGEYMDYTPMVYEESGNLSENQYSLEGWTFTGWNTQSNGKGTPYSDRATIANLGTGGTVALYAQWTPNEYIIKFDDNKPSNATGLMTGSMGEIELIYEKSAILLKNNYLLTGWTFIGWNTRENGSGISYKDCETVSNVCSTKEVTLYAQWKANEYTIVYNSGIAPSSDYGTIIGTMSSTRHTYDTFSSLNQNVYYLQQPAGVKDRIQEVVGWSTSLGGEVVYKTNAEISTVNSDGGETVLFAVWDFVKYVIYKPSNTLLTTPYYDLRPIYYRTYTYEDSVEIYDTQRDGYYYQCSTNYIPVHTTGDIYITWTKREINYKISYYVNGKDLEGKITSLKNSQEFELSYNQELTFTANDIPKYKFNKFILSYIPLLSPPEMLLESTEKEITIKQAITTDEANVILVALYDVDPYAKPECVAEGSLITLSDGSQKQVNDLTGDESLLVWNLLTGAFDVAPILFIDSDPAQVYEVINLYFSDGTTVKVISEHAFWDFDLNEYVFLRNDADKYIGHWFNKQIIDENGNMEWTKVQLIDVVLYEEYTTAWSPVTYGYLCYYVNGMLSMPGATEGLINIFDVDNETLKIDEVAMQNDIETYGLFTYEEFAEIYPITEEIFNAFNGQYLKISIGKGLITMEEIGELINHYAEFLS